MTKELESPEWKYIETKFSAFVQCGNVYRIVPRWNGLGDTKKIQSLMRVASAAPALYDALRVAKDVIRLNAPVVDDIAWEQFEQNSPKLRQINDALSLVSQYE